MGAPTFRMMTEGPDDDAPQPTQLDRIEAKLDELLAGQGRVDELIAKAGPALDELGTMADKLAQGGIMGLLKGK